MKAGTSKEMIIKGWRLAVVGLGLAFLGFALSTRVAMLQVVPEYERGYQFLQEQGDARTVRDVSVPASRGMILDRHGKPLAVSTPVLSVWADPKQVEISDAQLSQLSEILEISMASLRERLDPAGGKRFVYLSRGALPPSAEEQLAPLAEAGIYTMQEYRRYYPAGEIAAQVIGVTDIDDRGLEGVELGFDDWLTGTPGMQRVIRDLQGRVVESAQILEPAEPGKDIWLTLDSRLQFLAYRELKSAVTTHQASSGSVVILDVHSGDVLAMVNQPSFNPNSRRNLTASAVRNRAITDTFEPGSTVKPFTMLAALESGKFTPETIVDTSPGSLRVDGKVIHDEGANYGPISLTQILAKSSQVGTTMVAMDLEPEDMRDTLMRVGMGDLPGTGIPGEISGSLPQRYEWRPIEQATLGYGYGLSVTALQLAQAYATLGNGGYRVAPRIFRDAAPMPPVMTADSVLVEQVRTMMQAVVAPGGTGTRAAVPGYHVAGKTGTVHMVGTGGYEEHRYSAIFAGLAPAENPEIAVVVLVSDPQSDDYSGGRVAAPVFGSIAGEALRLLGVPGTGQEDLLAARRERP